MIVNNKYFFKTSKCLFPVPKSECDEFYGLILANDHELVKGRSKEGHALILPKFLEKRDNSISQYVFVKFLYEKGENVAFCGNTYVPT